MINLTIKFLLALFSFFIFSIESSDTDLSDLRGIKIYEEKSSDSESSCVAYYDTEFNRFS